MQRRSQKGWFQKGWFRKRWLVDVAVVVVLVAGVRWYQQRDVARGTLPAALVAETLDGERVTGESLRGGPVLLHVSATWCGVCRAMAGNLEAVAADHRVVEIVSRSGTGLQLRGALGDSRAERWIDPSGSLARSLGVGAYPTSFFVDGEGRIRSVEVGYTSTFGLRLRMWWAGFW